MTTPAPHHRATITGSGVIVRATARATARATVLAAALASAPPAPRAAPGGDGAAARPGA